MNNYFDDIVSRLDIYEVAILGILSDQDATLAFKAIRRRILLQESKLSIAQFRKTIDKLLATQLIKAVSGAKEHKFFVTPYGLQAIEYSLKEVSF